VAVVLLLGFVLVPAAFLAQLRSLGVHAPVDPLAVAIWGMVLVALGTAEYLVRPTRAYGPATIAYALAILGYLLWLGARSPLSVTYHGATLALGYGGLLSIAMLVPLLELVSGILDTAEDARRPGERVRLDFPPAAV
jgi:hypothetical protein